MKRRFFKKLEKIATLRVYDYSDYYDSVEIEIIAKNEIARQVVNLCKRFKVRLKTTFAEENRLYMTLYLS
jgi:hypothetical protein